MEIEIIRQSVSKNVNQNDCILREDIQNLIKNYKIELKSLSKITGIDYAWLKDFMDGKNIFLDFFTNLKNFTEDNRENVNNSNIPNPISLSNIVSVLSYGRINEDERVKAVIDVLIAEFEINYETLAIYAGLVVEDVQSFMNDTNSISIEKKYKLAVASLFLHYLNNQRNLNRKPLRMKSPIGKKISKTFYSMVNNIYVCAYCNIEFKD